MNKLQVSFSQETIEKFLKIQLEDIKFQNEEKVLAEKDGIKLIANIHISKIGINEFNLISPNIIQIKNFIIEFEKLNIVASIDIKQIKNKKVIVTPDIPAVTVMHRVITPAIDVPDITLWDIDIFNDNPDMQFTVGLEEYLKPDITFAFSINTENLKVTIGLHEFKINDLGIPNSIADKITDHIIDEIKKKIKESVGNDQLGSLLENLGDLASYIPIPDFSGWIIENIIKNKKIEDLVTSEINSKLTNYPLYIPNNFTIGPQEKLINLSINNVVSEVVSNNLEIKVEMSEI